MEIQIAAFNRFDDIDQNLAKRILKDKGFKKQFDFEMPDHLHGSESAEVYSNHRLADLGIALSRFNTLISDASDVISKEDYESLIEYLNNGNSNVDFDQIKSYEEATIGDIADIIINSNSVTFSGNTFVYTDLLDNFEEEEEDDDIDDECESL